MKTNFADHRLVFILFSRFPAISGGRENWLFNILNHLERNQIASLVYCVGSASAKSFYPVQSLRFNKIIYGFSLQRLGPIYALLNRVSGGLLMFLDRWLMAWLCQRRLSPMLQPHDILIAMNPIIEMSAAVLLKSQFKIPAVCCTRGNVLLELNARFPGLSSNYSALLRQSYEEADLNLANGWDTQKMMKEQGVTAAVLENGVNYERFANPEDRLTPALKQIDELKQMGCKIILNISTLRKIKGVDTLLLATQKLSTMMDPHAYKVVLAGRGRISKYQQIAEQLGIAENVIFLGQVSETPQWLNRADVVCCLSGGSGISMSLLEAMAAKALIVAWDSPVYTQILAHQENALLAETDNPQDLAKQLHYALGNLERLTSLREGAQERASRNDWSKIGDQFLLHIKQLLANGRGDPSAKV